MQTGLEPLLEKLAKPGKKKEEESHLGRTLGTTGVAGTLPFLGMLGQQPIQHKPRSTQQAKSLKHLLSQIQPGDVVMTGNEPSKKWHKDLLDAKGTISLSTGTPEGYHVGVVRKTGPRESNFRMIHSHPATGVGLAGPEELQGRVQVFRPRLNAEEMQQFLNNLDKDVGMGKKITQTLRGNKRLRAQINPETARASLYSENQGIGAGLKELFVPKMRSAKAIEMSRQQARAAREAFQAKPYLDEVAKNWKNLEYASDFTRFAPKCVGSVCSTLPAGALPAGKAIVPNKLVSEVLPSDYSRSKLLDPVTRYDPFKRTRIERVLEHGPLASRLLASGALMGATYGGNKLYDYLSNR